MEHKENIMLRLFLVLFALSISMTVIPSGILTAYGIFGEAKASIVTEESAEKAEEVGRIAKKDCSVRQASPYNIWFVLWVLMLCLIYASYEMRLPGRDTIVTLKVRMDD